jgi:hypothetical protein
MENHGERAVEATVGVERGDEGVAETTKKWVAPELRKFEIAEVTAANITVNPPDGSFSS